MVKKIVLEVKGKQITLSLEQAKELHAELNEFFGKEQTYVPYDPLYNPWWNRPYRNPYYYGQITTAGYASTELTDIAGSTTITTTNDAATGAFTSDAPWTYTNA